MHSLNQQRTISLSQIFFSAIGIQDTSQKEIEMGKKKSSKSPLQPIAHGTHPSYLVSRLPGLAGWLGS
jgi:hypothetical protein